MPGAPRRKTEPPRNPEGADRNSCVPAASSGDSRGFTLLEVMVAVAILALVMVTLLGVKNRSMQDVQFADHMTTATLLAKRTMTEMLQNTQGKQQESEDEGDFPEEEFKDFKWRKTVTPLSFQFENTPVTITELKAEVFWNEGAHQETVELVSYE